MAATALLTACSNEVVDQPTTEKSPIAFSSFVDKTTKADPSHTTANLNEFNVYGYIVEPAESSTTGFTSGNYANLFAGVPVTKGNDGIWTYDETKYWLDGATYNFCAIAPTNMTGVTVKINDDDKTYDLTIANFKVTDGKTDIIFADPDQFKYSKEEMGDKTVEFTFRHLMSKVKFSFASGMPTSSGISVGIREVKITNAVAQATVNADATTTTWSGHTGTVTLDFGRYGSSGAALPTNGSLGAIGDELLLIPAEAQDYTVTFVAIARVDGKEIADYSITATIKNQELKAGYAYNFTATINENNIQDSGLYPIKFSVSSVSDWTTGTGNTVTPNE